MKNRKSEFKSFSLLIIVNNVPKYPQDFIGDAVVAKLLEINSIVRCYSSMSPNCQDYKTFRHMLFIQNSYYNLSEVPLTHQK